MMKITALAAVLLLSSCATGFNREWRQSLAAGKPASGKDVTGAWLGTWRSEVNGHSGKLHCVVTRLHAAPCTHKKDTYRFHYQATFMKVFSASYAVEHRVAATKDGFTFSGDQILSGIGGGLYHYEGKGTSSEFCATYRSRFDRGVFQLKRPSGL